MPFSLKTFSCQMLFDYDFKLPALMMNNSSARYLHVALPLPQTAILSSVTETKRENLGSEFTNWDSVLSADDHVTLQDKCFQHVAQGNISVPYYSDLLQAGVCRSHRLTFCWLRLLQCSAPLLRHHFMRHSTPPTQWEPQCAFLDV